MDERIGQQFGKYRLVQLLGQGGFANVYLGEHMHLGTYSAIKILTTRFANSDEIQSFQREAYHIAHLEHPHIVRVFDFDVIDDTPFIVMQYAAGGTLRQRHPRGSILPVPTVVSYVRQVADALQYAHNQRIVHRDIKPENMLVGQHNEVLLSDFGIAVVVQSSHSYGTQDIAGTISYMAPEQIQGHPHPSSDQYSLGTIVYEWLSGDRPFYGSMMGIAAQQLTMVPRSLREKIPTISPEVERVVLTALAKDVKGRFSSVQAFAEALEQASQSMRVSQPLILTTVPSSNQMPSGGRNSAEPSSQRANGDHPTLQTVPQTSLAPSGFTYTSKRTLRRSMLLGLGLVGLAGVGGGMIWLTRNAKPVTPTIVSRPTPTTVTRPNLIGYYSDASGQVTIGLFREIADQPQEQFKDFAVEIDSDMVVVGGGGRGIGSPAGAYLTASYPREDMAAWLISSKDHMHPDPHRLIGFAIGLKIAGISRDELLRNHDIMLFSGDSQRGDHPEATVTIPGDFVLLGGGFNVLWQGAGSLATASFPTPANSWTAWTSRSKDHELVDLATLTTYAIGLRRKLRVGTVSLHVDMTESVSAANPTSTAPLPQGFALTGGGAEVHWISAGNLLWQLEPAMLQDQKSQQFIASSKDLDLPDHCTITTYALGIQIV